MDDVKQGRRWIFAGYARKGVRVSLALSLTVFAVYLFGSVPDPGFSDRLLFFLLRLLRYTSLLLCAFSLFALGFSVHRLVHFPGIRSALSLLFYFIVGLLGAIFSMLDSFIVVATGGNV
ncbi:MAG: hypothetical protein FWF55_05700 [Treponema sp.]|nr:hypothetical protein [Treponema sp.]